MSKSKPEGRKRKSEESSRESISRKKHKKDSIDSRKSEKKKRKRKHSSSSSENWSSDNDRRKKRAKQHKRSRSPVNRERSDKKGKRKLHDSRRSSKTSSSRFSDAPHSHNHHTSTTADANSRPQRSRFSDAPTPVEVDHEVYEKKKTEEEAAKKAIEEKEQKILVETMEEERRKRRERVLAWREMIKKDNPGQFIESEVNSMKTWTLEDDCDDDDEDGNKTQKECKENNDEVTGGKKARNSSTGNENNVKLMPNHTDEKVVSEEEDDGIDPLDAFMSDLKGAYSAANNTNITCSSNTISGGEVTTLGGNSQGAVQPSVIQTVVKSIKAQIDQEKPELIEQNADAPEYSSEDDRDDFDLSLLTAKKTHKSLAPPDHRKIYYKPFRKSFYIEVPELMKMTDEEVNAYRLELENITIRGKNCPKPFKKWAQIGVSVRILDILKRQNYEKPTPIQAQAIPAVMSGRDIIGIAKTGSGKTLAFLLPMFRHVMDQPPLEDGDGPIAIIMTPTRELALQIFNECKKFTKVLNLNPTCIYGGSAISEQIAELKRGTEIVVCTPGRMIDMLAANNGKVTNCRRCTFLVLDEADRMFDMGFEPQVTKIIEQIRPDRQTTLFTATFSTTMEALARRILNKPIEIVVGSRNKVCSDVKQHMILIDEDNKFFKLLELLGIYQESGSVLVFVEKQESADILLKDLFKKGYPCLTLHGGMDQYDRDSTITDFKNGVINLLIATSVAARGLDVKNIVLVVNFDCPNHAEDYVHRCGRTARAGSKGTAITFITKDDAKYLKDLLTVTDPGNCDIQPEIIEMNRAYIAAAKAERTRVVKPSGFSGKGFKFDENEQFKQNEMKKMMKWSLGWQDSGDEAEEEEKALTKIEADIERAFSSHPRRSMGMAGPVDKGLGHEFTPYNMCLSSSVIEKVELAQSIASKINEKINNTVANTAVTQLAASFILKGESSGMSSSNIGLAKQIADKLNVKLNYTSMATEHHDVSQLLGQGDVFFEEIDINDFPQQARWRVTSKETLATIAELSECAITVRGQYCPKEKNLPNAERRLYLLIEGSTEMKVQIAKAEIKRLLKEECVKTDAMFMRPGLGRYSIT